VHRPVPNEKTWFHDRSSRHAQKITSGKRGALALARFQVFFDLGGNAAAALAAQVVLGRRIP
jgi:hypothetical protein